LFENRLKITLTTSFHDTATFITNMRVAQAQFTMRFSTTTVFAVATFTVVLEGEFFWLTFEFST
jgi:hypothetical protein